MKKLMLPLLLTLMAPLAFADRSQVPQVSKSVQKFLDENGTDVSLMQPSCASFEACSNMFYHTKDYFFEGDAQKAFELLVSLKPSEVWHGSTRFEMEYDPETDSFLGKKDDLPDFKEKQVFFLDLDIINWPKKMQIPVAFQVVDLDHKKRSISFSYLKQNKSNGIQRITFEQVGEKIKIQHETRFQSESKLRDKLLYRFFHTLLLNDVWKGYGKILKEVK